MKHALPLDRVRGLVAAEPGLTAGEVMVRRQRHGANDIVETVGHPVADLARETARDPMIWFLVGTSVLYAVLGQSSEAITLLVSIAPLVGMDAYLHRRTQASTQGLRGVLTDTARVVRDGAEHTIRAADVVVGDLAVVATGEPFPADGVIVAGSELAADESALTGEAFPVDKRPLAGEPDGMAEPPVDHMHWGFAGTRLLTGRARLRITAVGGDTLYGAIVRQATGAVHERTPLQRAVASLVSTLLAAAVILCTLLALVRLRQGYGWADAVVSAVSLAVAALPEEFPVVLTVFLGVGVYRLARRKALVNRAAAVENIGRISCICSDKTGTITLGQLRVARVVPAERPRGERDAEPETEPDGEPKTEPDAEPDAEIDEARVLAIAAAAARYETGDPLDRAILDAAGHGADGDLLATFPFTEDRRRETAVIRDAGSITAYTKGAPETVLAMCSGDDRDRWEARAAELAAGGHKVVGCASRALIDYPGGEPDREMTFAGLIAIADPVRDGVADAIAWCRAAGIRVVVVTGDHPATARAVARDIGLADPPVIATGEALTTADDLAAAVRDVDVVARALPAHKLAIVRALQRAGEIVAVTGDGVNDVPALQAADVGIAMGQHGARSAREVSSIVLLNDDFDSIVAAIAEGRSLFDNLRKSFQYLLMIHIPLVLTATFIPLMGYPVLYLPIHIVWLEAMIHPTALLVFQSAAERDDIPPGRGGEVRLFSRAEWSLIAVVGALITVVVAITYDRSLAGGDDAHARAMAMVALTTASASVTAVLSRLATAAARVVTGLSLAAALVLVQTPLAPLLHLRPLHLDDWMLALAGGAVAVLPLLGVGVRGGGHTGKRPARTERRPRLALARRVHIR